MICDSTMATPLKVYILAGQSNMEGHAHVRTFDHMGMDPKTAPLLKEMRSEDGTPRVCEKVWISYLHSGGVKAGKLTTGFGAQKNGPKIGPEFTFGLTLEKELDEPILLIKTAWGGKNLHTQFRPPSAATEEKPVGEYYKLMADHVKTVLKDIKQVYPDYNDEQGYEAAGFVWFQGWNDMVDSRTYPNRGKAGGYDMYSDLLAQFIGDVRKDFDAPEMRFVIGVMGTGGVLDLENPTRYTPIHNGFRLAMAKPASLPQFKGNVVAVLTENYWDEQLGELDRRWGKIKGKNKELSKDTTLTKEQRAAALEAFKAELFTPEELKIREIGISNFGFHYLGSGKVMAQIGRGFAEAVLQSGAEHSGK
jgi:hypothetical protein